MVGGILATLAGVVALVATWRAWTGRWRSWTQRIATRSGAAPITLCPALGIGLLIPGLAQLGLFSASNLIVAAAFAAMLPLLLFYFVTPRWWGPRWYRERARDEPLDLGDPLTALAYAGVAATMPAAERPPLAPPRGRDLGPVLESWHGSWISGEASAAVAHGLTHAGAVEGRLFLHERGVGFSSARADACLRGETASLGIMAEDLVAARVVPRGTRPDARQQEPDGGSPFARLVLDTAEDSYLFELQSARRTAERIAETLHVQLAPT